MWDYVDELQLSNLITRKLNHLLHINYSLHKKKVSQPTETLIDEAIINVEKKIKLLEEIKDLDKTTGQETAKVIKLCKSNS